MTVKTLIEQIKQKEHGNYHKIYIVSNKYVDTKRYYYHNHIIDGKRCYKVYHQIVYANNEERELKKKVLDYTITQASHFDMSLSGSSKVGYHNVYHIYVNNISKGNVITIHSTSYKYKHYTEKELKRKRFYL